MNFNLCYKTYPFNISQGACKRFTDATKLDLHAVLMEYIYEFTTVQGEGELKKLIVLSKLYSREIACHLFYAISDTDKKIPLEEFQDATYRVSWVQSERNDFLSEPWPLIILDIAMKVNEYIAENIHVKKKAMSD